MPNPSSLKARVLNFIARPSSWIFRTWYSTLQVHHDVADPTQDPRTNSSGFIISSWHGDLFINGNGFNDCGISVMISNSTEGEFATRVSQHLGYNVVRGSSKRGGARAMFEMIDVAQQHNVAFAIDGPKGPREVVKDGAVFLAAQTGLPIVALGNAYSWAKRFDSWDRMVLAYPGSRNVVCLWPGMHVPQGASDAELRECNRELQERMGLARARAQELLSDWVRTGRRPQPGSNPVAAKQTLLSAA